MKKIAVLIFGPFTMNDYEQQQINNLFTYSEKIGFDVFILTYRIYSDYIKRIPNVRVCKFIEDNQEWINEENKIKKMNNTSIFQFYKLKIIFDLMENYKNENNLYYDAVYKIRVDIYKPNYRGICKHCNQPAWFIKIDPYEPFYIPENINDNEIFVKTDQFFIGTFKTIKKVSMFYDYIYKEFFDDHKYFDLDYDALIKSDMNTIRYDTFVYPNIIDQSCIDMFTYAPCPELHKINMNENTTYLTMINSKNILKNNIKNKLDELKKYKFKHGDVLLTGKGGMKTWQFRPEKCFALYLNAYCHLITKEIPNIRNGG
jgi:hypothetical protein